MLFEQGKCGVVVVARNRDVRADMGNASCPCCLSSKESIINVTRRNSLLVTSMVDKSVAFMTIRRNEINKKNHAPIWRTGHVFSCLEDPLARVSSEGSGVVVKSLPPLENRNGGWVLAMGTIRLAFQAREEWCAVTRLEGNEYEDTLIVVFVPSAHSPVRYQVSTNIHNKKTRHTLLGNRHDGSGPFLNLDSYYLFSRGSVVAAVSPWWWC